MKKVILISLILVGFMCAMIMPVYTIMAVVETPNSTEKMVVLDDEKEKVPLALESTSEEDKDYKESDNEDKKNEQKKISKKIKESLKMSPNQVIIDGKTIKENFKSHEESIIDGELLFELLDFDGVVKYYSDYDDLCSQIYSKAKYSKTFELDGQGKLVRYSYIAISK